MNDLHDELKGTKPEILTDEQLGRMRERLLDERKIGDYSAFLNNWEDAMDMACSVLASKIDASGPVQKALILSLMKGLHEIEHKARTGIK